MIVNLLINNWLCLLGIALLIIAVIALLKEEKQYCRKLDCLCKFTKHKHSELEKKILKNL